jgi:Flp pilus assembly protein TadG
VGIRPRRKDERGAAALEFGILVPVLFAMLFGIIDYGMWFSDSIGVRQGVREAARLGVVQRFDAPGCTSGTSFQKLACQTRQEMTAISGTSYAKVTATEWSRGKPLLVCGMVKADGLTGLVPLPSNGLVKSKTRMAIEKTTPVPADGLSYADTPPAGADWSWCS